MCTAGGYYRTLAGNNENGKIAKSKKFLFLNSVSETQKGEGKKERHTQNVVTRATNATRVRPEDGSTYVTTLFELTRFEFENVSWTSVGRQSKMSEMSVGRQKCQKCHIRSDEQIEQIRSDQIRSDQTVEKENNALTY